MKRGQQRESIQYMFLSDEELKTDAFSREANLDRNIFIEEGKLNVRLILAHFIETVPLA